MRGVLLPIIEKIPRTLYVEPYCGALGLFLGKPQERAEVVNDTNRALVNCLKTLRDRDAARIIRGYANARDRMMSYCERLQSVCVECLDALDCVKRYDHEDTLFFIDPPYNCASSACYRTSWTRDDERELVDVLTTLKGSFVLTVYDTDEYRRLVDCGARRVEHTKTTTVPTDRNAMIERVETIYIKANHERRSN